eukprot:4757196-Prymnesium_polylepis.2
MRAIHESTASGGLRSTGRATTATAGEQHLLRRRHNAEGGSPLADDRGEHVVVERDRRLDLVLRARLQHLHRRRLDGSAALDRRREGHVEHAGVDAIGTLKRRESADVVTRLEALAHLGLTARAGRRSGEQERRAGRGEVAVAVRSRHCGARLRPFRLAHGAVHRRDGCGRAVATHRRRDCVDAETGRQASSRHRRITGRERLRQSQIGSVWHLVWKTGEDHTK